MSSSSKYLIIFIILAFAGNQLYLIVSQFSDTRIIEVRKEIYESNEKDYLKGYNIENAPFEQFDIRVQPKSFFDYLLLTNQHGNLLGIVLSIAGCCCLARYVYVLEFERMFSNKNFRWIRWAFALIALSFLSDQIALSHTKDFWNSIYVKKGKGEGYAFYVETEYNRVLFALVFWASLTFLSAVSENYRENSKAAAIIPKE